MIGTHRQPSQSTTFVVTVLDQGDPGVVDDESYTHFEFSLPDGGARTLPITISPVEGTWISGGVWSSERGSFRGGSFTLTKSVPGGFVANYDLGSGKQRIVGQGVVRPTGVGRLGTWPYDPRQPVPSLRDRAIQMLKDAWNGAI